MTEQADIEVVASVNGNAVERVPTESVLARMTALLGEDVF